jgi:hypothetical protein
MSTGIIKSPHDCMVLASATVDLISKVQRPWLFRVTVVGKPPHLARRVYEIAAISDSQAAMVGIEKFVKEMSQQHPARILAVL